MGGICLEKIVPKLAAANAKTSPVVHVSNASSVYLHGVQELTGLFKSTGIAHLP